MSDPTVSRMGAGRMAHSITYNEALERGAERTYREKIPVKGPSLVDIERIQKGKPKVAHGVAAKVGLKVGLHGGAHHLAEHGGSAAKKLAGKVGLKVLTAVTAEALISAAIGDPSRSEGDKALIREHYSQATALLAQSALPAGYTKARVTDEVQARGRLTETVASLGVLTGSGEKADALMSKFVQEARQSAFEGVQYGVAYEVRSQADLEKLIARDKSLGERFEEDLAFREGMLSVVWLAKNNPAEYEARRGLMVSQQSAASRAR